MTLSKIVPWGQKQVPIRRTQEYSTPTIWADMNAPWREMEQLFDRVLGISPVTGSTSLAPDFSPLLDVHETEKSFQVSLEMPGMSEKDVDISISRDTLIVSGEKKEEKEENAKGIYRLERRYGSFTRSIPLPENCIDTDKAEAICKNGILTITLPKATGYKESVKKIPVLTGKGDDPARSETSSSSS